MQSPLFDQANLEVQAQQRFALQNPQMLRVHLGGDVLAVKGRWLADDTFEIVSHFVNDGIVTRARLAFRDREIDATFTVNNGLVQRVHAQRAD